MTIDEFNSTGWQPGMIAVYMGHQHSIVACDFKEFLVALAGVVLGTDEPSWVRCENIALTESATPKFQKVWCSQCGKDFGPGNSGFSHCENHLNEKEGKDNG